MRITGYKRLLLDYWETNGCVLSRYKMSGELPLLSLRISDDKLRSVLELIDSIPLPESRPPARKDLIVKVGLNKFLQINQG